MNEFALVAIASIFSSNVVAVAGVGAVSLQAEKKNFFYMLVNTMCIVVSVIISGLAYYAVENYILLKANALELKLVVLVIFAVLLSFASSAVLKATSKELYFLYEKSYGLAVQTITIVGTLLLCDYSRTFLMTMFELSMFCVGFLLVQFLFWPIYERLDNHHTLKPARNVPIMLYCLSVVSMLFYIIMSLF